MCGIAGVFNFDGSTPAPDTLTRMSNRLLHRGPDGEGHFVDGSIGLVHRRLAIIDRTAAGDQPMTNEDRTLWVVFNGEIYNFRELRVELQALGHTFRSRSDTEVILHGYEEWGRDCLGRFNGMFAFALWNTVERRLWLVRDRLGIKPLFFCRIPGGLAFGSEVKAVLSDPRVPRQLNHESLAYYLALNYLPSPHTMFTGVCQIRPAHYLEIDEDGDIRDVEYWDLPYDKDLERTDSDYEDELESLLGDAVEKRLVSDVPFGAFLSGGLDSSGLVYWMSKHHDQPINTFSIGFQESTYDETPYARRVADSMGSVHHEKIVDSDAVSSILPKLVWHSEEPTADSSMLAVFYLAGLAREHVGMVQSGDGADEIFAGYDTYSAYDVWQVFNRLPAWLQAVVTKLVSEIPDTDSKIGWTAKAKRFVSAAHLSWQSAHASWRLICNPIERRALLSPIGDDADAHADAVNLFLEAFRSTKAVHPLDQMLDVDTRVYLPGDMLVKTDRMTMAHGLEARVPYLDHRVVELAARLPTRLKLNGFRNGKYLLRRILANRLPKQVVRRAKAGFNIPKGIWFKGQMREFVHDHLAPARIQRTAVLDPEVVQLWLAEHFSGKTDRSHQLWGLLVLMLWYEQFMTPRFNS